MKKEVRGGVSLVLASCLGSEKPASGDVEII